uniref:Uncharacterized protein n=1 Tax=Ditylenchus dipsaci TaxID=166011 RepID=A0A915EN49_9BILA
MNSQTRTLWALLLVRNGIKKTSYRQFWIHPMYEQRVRIRAYARLMPQFEQFPNELHSYLRMDSAMFALLLQTVTSRLLKTSIT